MRLATWRTRFVVGTRFSRHRRHEQLTSSQRFEDAAEVKAVGEKFEILVKVIGGDIRH